MHSNHDCECRKESCGTIRGNAFDVDLKKCDSEIRADVIVGREKRCVRVWGQVKDCDGNPVKDALVKLLKPTYRYGKIEFVGVAHTVTDCLGFYQFEVCPEDDNTKFRIIVSKACYGSEREIEVSHNLCNPCNPEDC